MSIHHSHCACCLIQWALFVSQAMWQNCKRIKDYSFLPNSQAPIFFPLVSGCQALSAPLYPRPAWASPSCHGNRTPSSLLCFSHKLSKKKLKCHDTSISLISQLNFFENCMFSIADGLWVLRDGLALLRVTFVRNPSLCVLKKCMALGDLDIPRLSPMALNVFLFSQ